MAGCMTSNPPPGQRCLGFYVASVARTSVVHYERMGPNEAVQILRGAGELSVARGCIPARRALTAVSASA